MGRKPKEVVSLLDETNVNENVSLEKETKTKAKETQTSVSNEPLTDASEIEVKALIPNVCYSDKNTFDSFEWEDVGHVEVIEYSIIKNMWRNHRKYFTNLYLRPLDERVVKKFGLDKLYANVDFLMDSKSYTREKIDKVCEAIHTSPKNLKKTIATKVKSMVTEGEITDAYVIRTLETKLSLDLFGLIGE